MQTVKAATKEFENLQKSIFNEFRIGLLHGKMKSKEKDEMRKMIIDLTAKVAELQTTVNFLTKDEQEIIRKNMAKKPLVDWREKKNVSFNTKI